MAKAAPILGSILPEGLEWEQTEAFNASVILAAQG